MTTWFRDNSLSIGNTPLVKLNRVTDGAGATVLAKVEGRNPAYSVKCRIGAAMVWDAETKGLLGPGKTIVEPTSGNTGLALAMAAALRGYKLVCTAPDKISKEKTSLLRAFGAEVITCPTSVAADDPRSYYKVAERIRDERGAYLPNQYENPANPLAHYASTGPEIWKQTEGKVTHWVAGVGTGGTIGGTAKYLKEQNPTIRVIGVDTVGSIYAYYRTEGKLPPADQIHQYLVDGIGEDFLPSTVWWDYIDEIITVDDKAAYRAVFELARKEAILGGSSAGAAAVAARRVAEASPDNAIIVTLFPDSGERYLSKLNPDWLRANGLLEEGMF